MKCSNCGSASFKEGRQCPLKKGNAVCISCCKKCEYYNVHNPYVACTYYIKARKDQEERKIVERRKDLKAVVEKYNKAREEQDLVSAVILLAEKIRIEKWFIANGIEV